MLCFHKFHDDLNLQNLNFEPTRLVVGTFNPSWPPTNTAQWFYGRTKNNCFWDVVPRLQGRPSLINGTPSQWKSFCRENKIALTDLITSIGGANPANPEHVTWLADYSDTNIANNFNSHNFTNIVAVLQKHPTIEKVYLTRGATGFWAALWQPVENYCNQKNIICHTLLTPSKNARFSFGRFKRANPTTTLTLNNYVLQQWRPKW